MKLADLSTPEALDALPDRSLILTHGGIVLQKYDGWHSENKHGWQRPGHTYNYSTADLVDRVHQPIKFIAAIA